MKKNKRILGTAMGLTAGIFWGLDTVLMGVILLNSPFPKYAAFAPLIATFLHDTFSSIWLLIYTGIKKNFSQLKSALTKKSGRFVVLGALFGGPLGMTGYMMSIKYIGTSNAAVISAMYPIVGSLLSYIFLKEKLKPRGIVGLLLAVAATMVMGLTSKESPANFKLGFMFALLCVIGWGSESVICSYGMKGDVSPDIALQIRQLTSSVTYAVAIVPFIKGYALAWEVLTDKIVFLIIFTALIGTTSYLCYYRAIDSIGPTRAMGLNISYSAWAVLIGIFFGNGIDFKLLFLSAIIIMGSILTADNPKEFLHIFSNK